MMWWFPCAVGILQNGFVGSASSFSSRKCDPSTMRILTDLLFLLFLVIFMGTSQWTASAVSHHVPRQYLHEGARALRRGGPAQSTTFTNDLSDAAKSSHFFLNGSLLSFKVSDLQHVKKEKNRQTARCFDGAHFLILQSHMKKQICFGCKIKLSHKYAGLNTCQHMF